MKKKISISRITNKVTREIAKRYTSKVTADWIMIEPTSACNLKCKMCPRIGYTPHNQNMSMQTLKKIVHSPCITDSLIELSGWGEPFLHPNIVEFVDVIKYYTDSIVTTTNGTLLQRMIDAHNAGLNRFTLSIDGGTKETYEKIRIGSSWESVLTNLRTLVEIGASVRIMLVIMKENKDDLLRFVNTMGDIGVRNIRVKDLDVIAHQYAETQSLCGENMESTINALQERANELGISLSVNRRSNKKRKYCALAFNLIYISSEGNVSPCCILGNPISLKNEDGETSNVYTVFGNVNKHDLETIWNNSEYKAFRKKWLKRQVPLCCEHCYLLREYEHYE